MTVDVEGKPLTMEVDTGAVVSIISDSTRRELLPNMKLHRSNIFLKTYTDQEMEVVGLSPEFWSGEFWSGGPKFSVENWSGRTDFFGKNGPPLENWSE